jgi:hypothetical protein
MAGPADAQPPAHSHADGDWLKDWCAQWSAEHLPGWTPDPEQIDLVKTVMYPEPAGQ